MNCLKKPISIFSNLIRSGKVSRTFYPSALGHRNLSTHGQDDSAKKPEAKFEENKNENIKQIITDTNNPLINDQIKSIEKENLKLKEFALKNKEDSKVEKESFKREIQEFIVPLLRDETEDIFEVTKKGCLKEVEDCFSKDPYAIYEKNSDYWTCLHFASKNGHLEIVNFLLSKMADVEAKDSKLNSTPLNIASYYGHVPVVEALLDKGANIDHQDDSQMTPLHSAVLNNQLAVVKVLIARGADPFLKDEWDETPYEMASGRNLEAIVNYLYRIPSTD